MVMERAEHRLAAIMVTDVVGYSRLMEHDEARTLTALKQVQTRIFEPAICEFSGRIVKTMGDGWLVVFNSAVDAVECALSMQKRLEADQSDVSALERITVRIGINLADVVVDGDEFYGDGVNVAARLEASALPGGICIADAVHREVAAKAVAEFEDAGEVSLKNISRPIHVWHWPLAPVQAAPRGGKGHARTTVAVLPFEDLSQARDQTYFSDGVTEDIIAGLSRFRSLSVIAANSSFHFRARSTPLDEIARKLSVQYVVVGSVRRSGNKIRITAQLIEAASGTQLWADRFDRELVEVFSVQDEVTRMIVSNLVGQIESQDFQHALRKPTTSLAAYDLYLRGLVHLRGYQDNDNSEAVRMFEAALELDPMFALARAYLALSRVAVGGYASAPPALLDEALAASQMAAALDQGNSVCQRIIALVLTFRREFDAAERHYRQAYQLNPNDANGLVGMGGLIARRGRLAEATQWIEEGWRLNPLPPPWYHAVLGNLLYVSGRYDEAAAALRELPNPGAYTHARLAACYAQAGRMSEANAQVAIVLRLREAFSTDVFLNQVLLIEQLEHRALYREGLLKAGLPE
ncbi:hypothetical protein ASG42_11110 [Rhizobium sp. Leaf391]|nr:hypothetical protein ASG42_11110 [Rhizobium sp. Leaf391]